MLKTCALIRHDLHVLLNDLTRVERQKELRYMIKLAEFVTNERIHARLEFGNWSAGARTDERAFFFAPDVIDTRIVWHVKLVGMREGQPFGLQ